MMNLRRHPRSILPRWTVGKPVPTKPAPTGVGGGNGHVQCLPALVGHGLPVLPAAWYSGSKVSSPEYPVHKMGQPGGVQEVQASAMRWNHHTPSVLRQVISSCCGVGAAGCRLGYLTAGVFGSLPSCCIAWLYCYRICPHAMTIFESDRSDFGLLKLSYRRSFQCHIAP